MAKGSLKDPFKMTGQQIGSTAGAALGSLIPIPGVGPAIGGLIGGLFGGGGSQVQAEPSGPSQAEQDLKARMQAFEDYEFKTTNPFESMNVNLQAAQFQRDQQAQEQADTLQALRSGATGAGAAALATAMSRQAAKKQQAIAADIGKQEQAINMAAAKQEAQNQQARQAFELDRMTTMLGINMAQVTGEEQARLAADQAKMNRSSQLLGTGVNLLGTLGSAFISGGGLNPGTSTSGTPTQFADLSNLGIDTSFDLGNLSLTTPR